MHSQVRTHTCTHTCTQTCTRACTRACAHMHAHLHTHLRAHMHAHMHARMRTHEHRHELFFICPQRKETSTDFFIAHLKSDSLIFKYVACEWFQQFNNMRCRCIVKSPNELPSSVSCHSPRPLVVTPLVR